MATPSEKLADSLNELKALQEKGIIAIKSDALTRTHRERLLENGFIEEVYKGWYIAVAPDVPKGDSTSWYSNYWEFCVQYLNDRFGDQWCLYPEQSLLLHAGNSTIPQQLMVRTPGGNNLPVTFLYHTSIFIFKWDLPPKEEMVVLNGLRLHSLPASLVRCAANTFVQNPIDARTALSMIRDASDVLPLLLDGGHSVVAGRLAGAFRNIGQNRIADAIISTMEKAGYEVREADPFETQLAIPLKGRVHSPHANRIRLMWEDMRGTVLSNFPAPPGIPANVESYLEDVEAIYVTDAYHSLSIEKYKVTPELIEKVRIGTWNLTDPGDQKEKNAMAARGYYDAFKAVEQSLGRILEGENAGTVVDEDHGTWYTNLFGPSVAAGLLKPSDLAGYRNHQVYIGRSMHTPLNREAVRDAMPVLFELLEGEKEAAVRAVLGHFIFVYIHPYMDGNGRMGRFLMNAMLASGGYPWTVIPVERRQDYMDALEAASVKGNIEPFAKFLGYLVGEGIKGTPVAKI